VAAQQRRRRRACRAVAHLPARLAHPAHSLPRRRRLPAAASGVRVHVRVGAPTVRWGQRHAALQGVATRQRRRTSLRRAEQRRRWRRAHACPSRRQRVQRRRRRGSASAAARYDTPPGALVRAYETAERQQQRAEQRRRRNLAAAARGGRARARRVCERGREETAPQTVLSGRLGVAATASGGAAGSRWVMPADLTGASRWVTPAAWMLYFRRATRDVPSLLFAWLLTHSAMLVYPDDPTGGHTIALPLPASGHSDALAPSLPQSRGASGRSGCECSRSPEPVRLGDTHCCHPGKVSGLPVLPVLEPRGPGGSSRGSSRFTPSSSPGAGLRHPPVYHEGMVYYPSIGGPSAGQAGQQHGS
jgi:hypothetical protein